MFEFRTASVSILLLTRRHLMLTLHYYLYISFTDAFSSVTLDTSVGTKTLLVVSNNTVSLPPCISTKKTRNVMKCLLWPLPSWHRVWNPAVTPPHSALPTLNSRSPVVAAARQLAITTNNHVRSPTKIKAPKWNEQQPRGFQSKSRKANNYQLSTILRLFLKVLTMFKCCCLQ